MKKFYAFLFFISFVANAQTNGKTCELLGKITALINRQHFKPKPVDDSLSVYVFDTFMDAIDEGRSLITKSEYEKLSAHRLTLDNEILSNNCDFIDEFAAAYKKGLERKKSVLEKMQSETLDFSGKDSIKFIKDGLKFDLAENDLERVWKKRLRFDILDDMSKSGKLDSVKQNFTAIEKMASNRIFQNYLCKINGLLDNRNGFMSELQNQFLDIFCNYFDPHTNYFALDAKKNFMSALSVNNLSLGLELGMNEKDEIVVDEIIPGGPAAQSKKFEKDDVIVKVSDKDGREYLVSCTAPETIGEIIFSDTNREIKLTIRKKNGTQLDVALVKQVMKSTENSAYSFIAEKKSRVGYIKIPDFYSDFDGFSLQGVAQDVATEIAKLSKDGISGLVLDLQDNGGGSMDEAVRLAGLFIDSGPVAVAVNKSGNQEVLRDTDRGIYYDGPIVILINGQSASASEFFAGAMQDYKRAMIIGATSLGKATVQTILPLDQQQQEFVKVTIQKFYRITGESGQIKGIVPDVYLPVLYDSITPREKSYKTALKYDFIKPKIGKLRTYGSNHSELIAKSKMRVQNSSRFEEIVTLNKEINKVYNDAMPPIPLTLDQVYAKVDEINMIWKKVKAQAEMKTGCKISNNSAEAARIANDPLQQEINADKMKEVQANPYLEEAIEIITDWNIDEN